MKKKTLTPYKDGERSCFHLLCPGLFRQRLLGKMSWHLHKNTQFCWLKHGHQQLSFTCQTSGLAVLQLLGLFLKINLSQHPHTITAHPLSASPTLPSTHFSLIIPIMHSIQQGFCQWKYSKRFHDFHIHPLLPPGGSSTDVWPCRAHMQARPTFT